MSTASLLLPRDGAVNQPHPAPPPGSRPAALARRSARWVLMVALLGLSGALVFWAPAAAGTGWDEVGRTLARVGPGWLLALSALWIAGLASYGVVMTASLPGLSTRQALSLNLAGSAVANSVPLGGAVSLGLVTAMSRSWGFTRSSVTTFLLLTNLWNVLIRVLFGALSLAWLLTAGPGLVTGPAAPVIAALAVVLVLAVMAVLMSASALAWIGRVSAALVAAARSRLPRPHRPGRRSDAAHEPDYAGALLDLRSQLLTLIRTSWIRLTLGMLGYIGLLAALLDLCLRGLGTTAPITLMLAAVGIERLVTALPITPGGAGAAELSLVACLTAAGVPAVQALAATLLYRFFTFIAEFPAGAAVALGWRLGQSRLRARPTQPHIPGGITRIEPSA
jgi:uncharacterized membrane protein YbhN (UPF0104 family)